MQNYFVREDHIVKTRGVSLKSGLGFLGPRDAHPWKELPKIGRVHAQGLTA